MFSFSSLDNRTEENHTETIMSNYWNTLPVHWGLLSLWKSARDIQSGISVECVVLVLL